MTEKELSINLREDARRMGLCDEWYGEWQDDTDKQQLLDKYIRGLDFCFKHRWPSLPFAKAQFPQQLLRDNGILVDDKYSFPVREKETRRLVCHRNYVALGNSELTVRYSFRKNACNIWARDNSKIHAYAKYGSFMLVHLFDNAEVIAETDMSSKIAVICHSDKASVSKNGIVTVKDEFHYLE